MSLYYDILALALIIDRHVAYFVNSSQQSFVYPRDMRVEEVHKFLRRKSPKGICSFMVLTDF